MKIRVHTDNTTIDIGRVNHPDVKTQCEVEANRIVLCGVWDGDKLYPPSRIVMVELIPS